jgi:predicted component of type VI protein secretion system
MRRLKIGRSETNEISIADASVSRHHAELTELGDGRFTLSDLGSTYGTQVWLGERWIAAAGTEIRVDTKLRFGEYQTTLMDVLSDAQRAAFGLSPASAAAPAAPAAAPPPAADAPATAAPVPDPRPRTAPPAPAPQPVSARPVTTAPAAPTPPSSPSAAARPSAERAAPRPAARAAPARSATRRKSLMLGFLGLAIFAGLAGIVVAAILLFGDANPPPRPDTPPNAANAETQSRMLEACTKEWEVPERRCRCFLAAAGPHLLAEDYDDYAEMLEAYVSGDTDRQESALQRATEKRGAPASSRLTAAFKSAVRDCQQ